MRSFPQLRALTRPRAVLTRSLRLRRTSSVTCGEPSGYQGCQTGERLFSSEDRSFRMVAMIVFSRKAPVHSNFKPNPVQRRAPGKFTLIVQDRKLHSALHTHQAREASLKRLFSITCTIGLPFNLNRFRTEIHRDSDRLPPEVTHIDCPLISTTSVLAKNHDA